jgi:hypothetical protein
MSVIYWSLHAYNIDIYFLSYNGQRYEVLGITGLDKNSSSTRET